MKINGSWAILPGILAFAVIPITLLINIAPQTAMSQQVTGFTIRWVMVFGVLFLVGLCFDCRAKQQSRTSRARNIGMNIPKAWLHWH